MNIVITLIAEKVREIAGQTVVHTPIEPRGENRGNRAHAEVFGQKTTEARLKFMQIWKLVIGF